MKQGTKGRVLAAALAGVGFGAAGVAHGQAVVRQAAGTPQQLNPAEQTQAATPRTRARDVFSGPAPADCLPELRSSTVALKLDDVKILGLKGIPEAALRPAFEDMKGKTITVGAVCEIADRVSSILFARGFLARVYVPQQQFPSSGATVNVQVVEGHIVDVRYHGVGNVGPVQARIEGYLNHVRGTFNLDKIQRWLLLANDLPGMKVTAALAHSTAPITNLEDASGALDLDITIARRPEDVVAAVQNTSSNTLGPWSGIARVDFNSFTSLGERTTLIGYSTIGSFEQEVVQVLEQAHLGNSGLFVGAAFAYGRSAPGGDLAPLKLRGDSIVGSVEANYPLVRLRRAGLTLGGGMDFVSQKMDFPGGGVLSDDDLRVIWARAEGDMQQELLDTASGRITETTKLTVQLRKGIQGLGSSRAGQSVLSRLEGKPDALLVRGEGDSTLRYEPVGALPGMALNVHVIGQYADKPLLAYEELAIGDLTVGRGYDPDALSGDRVVAAEFKGEVGPFAFGRFFRAAPYAFYDIAYVSNLDTGSVNRTVRSIGVGGEFRLPYNLRADVYWAKPLDKTFATATARPPARVLAQIIFAY